MVDSGSDHDFKGYFTEDETGMYVVTDSLPRLKLKPEATPEDAPLYVNLDTGVGVYPEGVDSEVAYEAAKYALDKSDRDFDIHVSQDTETWQEEFSDLVDQDPELGPFWHLDLDEREKTSARR